MMDQATALDLFDSADEIFIYSRAEAIADGVLVDVTDWASTREMIGGFRIPVAMTAELWARVQAPKGSSQDTRGRAHDVLWLARCAVARNQEYFSARLGRKTERLRVSVESDGVTIGFPEDF